MKSNKAINVSSLLATMCLGMTSFSNAESKLPDPDGKPADMSKPVQVYILMGQSNMLRSEEHTSELQSRTNLVCRLLLEKKKRPWRTS